MDQQQNVLSVTSVTGTVQYAIQFNQSVHYSSFVPVAARVGRVVPVSYTICSLSCTCIQVGQIDLEINTLTKILFFMVLVLSTMFVAFKVGLLQHQLWFLHLAGIVQPRSSLQLFFMVQSIAAERKPWYFWGMGRLGWKLSAVFTGFHWSLVPIPVQICSAFLLYHSYQVSLCRHFVIVYIEKFCGCGHWNLIGEFRVLDGEKFEYDLLALYLCV